MLEKIIITDKEFSIFVNTDKNTYTKGMTIEKIHEVLKSKDLTIISLDWDGTPKQVFTNTDIASIHKSWFEPIDKGRPSVLVADKQGQVLFSVCIYEKENEFSIFDKYQARAW